MIKELAQYIENADIGLTINTDFFVGGYQQEGPDDCSALIDTGGANDLDLLDASEKTFQVLSRARDYQTARDKAYALYLFLHGKKGITLPVVDGGPTYYINVAGGLSLPQGFPPDEKGLYTFSTNYVLKSQQL